MIISRTPYRISFFGGGTDYPVWYRENGGAVLATTIDKYCYLTCRYLPPFFEHKHRIVWSKVESVKEISEIEHPAVRATLEYLKITEGLEIHHDGDLPARSGLGTSSSFTVGLLNALYALKGISLAKLNLATDAIHIERDILKENVGSQDQVLASFGGFNKISFNGDDEIKIQPVILQPERLEMLQSHLLLFFTGISRTASNIAKKQVENTPKKRGELCEMKNMVDEGVKILIEGKNIEEFGTLLDEAWKLKRSLSEKISTPEIDNIYETACREGALGGKILGAGGGGFVLFFAKPEDQPNIKEKLKKLLHVPFKFENSGSTIIFNSSSSVKIGRGPVLEQIT
ncbi:kinase [Candidatus Shapirobacteria bacterium CG08_land_8_20_14_0_20_39_18]|uniref:Kinase n=1 Tax=Candidatus Shapirobacteria bacterium CG08_land_8_20_14_0_20_39_18 TaxID=1974883 RepID=A0A2M6XC31_9BACT|nr:MAG: kinase [Candidatus Shapirobacteria bacterium CG08_land_8_20_14_0_20_39_18]PIY65378.1 MAG: kinase [Candidatus Shapirobacteria bacterium CG_4_10_14_0_8_um_filter_39_15]PJE68587.1 MAG: kinase [Candidatus Shapirobacteria bacterium CG10_big_fil_rev_8_21_14_0_10_38_8]